MDKKINKIAHLADIHIRKLHRFVEYRDVFDRLYEKLRESKPDLIYIGGDIVHGKLDTSPEETRLVAEFFLSLADISDLLVIPGNHDCNLNNASREDVLSPIIDLVKQINPRIHFWKKTGVYEMGGCQFGHLSVFDITKDGKPNAKNIPRAKDIDGDHKIAIYHGGVGNFQVDTGLVMSDEHVNVIDFDGYDLVLLGDIHKRQFLNDSEHIGLNFVIGARRSDNTCSKSWYYTYRPKGQNPTKIYLAPYPSYSVAAARLKAKQVQRDILDKKDPFLIKQSLKQELTLGGTHWRILSATTE